MKRAADKSDDAPRVSGAPAPGETDETDDELDWDLEPGEEQRLSVSSAGVSDPNLDALDSSWDEEEEEEEPEPELPDERLDPVAYAAAKLAREERAQARRERRRAKDAAKKARQKARAIEAKRKQKGKSKKPRVSAAPRPSTKVERTRAKVVTAESETPSTPPPSKKREAIAAKKSAFSRTNMWVLAVVLLVFIGAIGFAFFRAK
ncbi:MAG: hypothetical protein ABI421_08925 [Polyangiaceae bacterium]